MWFHGDRPKELGDNVAKIMKKEKNISSSGRPNEQIRKFLNSFEDISGKSGISKIVR